jgi:hypothetical protein
MTKTNAKFTTVIMLLVVIIGLYVEAANGQFCTIDCGNGYCCWANYPVCIQNFPVCCPLGTTFYYNGLCYFRSYEKSSTDQKGLAAMDAARTTLSKNNTA